MSYLGFFLPLILLIPIVSALHWWETGHAIILNNENFDQIVGQDKHVIIQFFTISIDCSKMYQDWNSLAYYYMEPEAPRDDIIVAKVHAGKQTELAEKYDIKSFPTIVLFKKGQKHPSSWFEHEEKSLISFIHFVEEAIGHDERNSEVINGLIGIEEKVKKLEKDMIRLSDKEGIIRACRSKCNADLAEVMDEMNYKMKEMVEVCKGEMNFTSNLVVGLVGVLVGLIMALMLRGSKKIKKKKVNHSKVVD